MVNKLQAKVIQTKLTFQEHRDLRSFGVSGQLCTLKKCQVMGKTGISPAGTDTHLNQTNNLTATRLPA